MTEPIGIKTEFDLLQGILRRVKDSKHILLILPANSGTRIGPQRIFVEIANEILKLKISTLCIDIPPLGDSYSSKKFETTSSFFENLTQKYSYYIDIIIKFLKENYAYNKFGLLSISIGCVPCFNYANIHPIIKYLVMLSPDNIIGSANSVNKKNLKSYFFKVFKFDTYKKILTLNLNINQIFKNIIPGKRKKNNSIIISDIKNKDLKILSLFGDKDDKKDHLLNYWNKTVINYNLTDYSTKIIPNSDHSYFGWSLKKAVIKSISEWFVENESIKNATK